MPAKYVIIEAHVQALSICASVLGGKIWSLYFNGISPCFLRIYLLQQIMWLHTYLVKTHTNLNNWKALKGKQSFSKQEITDFSKGDKFR